MEPVRVIHLPLADAVSHFQDVLRGECCTCKNDSGVVFDVMHNPFASEAHESRARLAKSELLARTLLTKGTTLCSLGHTTVTQEIEYAWDSDRERMTVTTKQPILAMCMSIIRRLLRLVTCSTLQPELHAMLVNDLMSVPVRIAVLHDKSLRSRVDDLLAKGDAVMWDAHARALAADVAAALTRIAELSCSRRD